MSAWDTRLKKKAVTFSYDDGVTQDIRLIELLNKYGLKATFNLNSDMLGRPGVLIRDNQRVAQYRIHAKDVKSVYEGHEVAAHTLTHPKLIGREEAEIVRQVEQDRIQLSELVGYDVVGMAYPGGGINNDDRVAGIIREKTGIRYARTTTCTERFALPSRLYRLDPTAFHLMEHEALMSLGEAFVNSRADVPQIFYVWGHSYELDIGSDGWARLEEFFKLIANRDDIFYGTNAEILL